MNIQKVKKGNDWTKDTSRFPEFVSYFSTERNARKCTSKMQNDVMMSKRFEIQKTRKMLFIDCQCEGFERENDIRRV